jgi:hypothetical protein
MNGIIEIYISIEKFTENILTGIRFKELSD